MILRNGMAQPAFHEDPGYKNSRPTSKAQQTDATVALTRMDYVHRVATTLCERIRSVAATAT